MRVHFLGVRGSTPAPGGAFVRYGGHTSSVALAHDGDEPSLIIDAGTGIRRASALLAGPFVGTVVLSHLHWDHVHGLPFFEAADRPDARVDLYIPDQLDGSDPLEVLARGMSPPHFPVRPDELRGAWRFHGLVNGDYELDGFNVTVMEIPHKGGRTYGFRVRDATATVAYVSDHCPTAYGDGPDGLGEYHEAAMALTKDADVLIHDSQLVREELAAEADFGHAAAEYAVELGRRSGVGRVMLYHHKPDRDDDALDAIGARFSAPPNVTIACQATVLTL